MNRRDAISIAVLLLFSGRLSTFGSDKTPTQLQAEIDREPNPKKRLKLAVELTDARLKDVLSAYEAEDHGKEVESIKYYLSGLDRLEKAVKDIRHGGLTKESEIRLREQVHALKDLAMSVSFSERAAVEEVATRVAKLHEEILGSIMNPNKERDKP